MFKRECPNCKSKTMSLSWVLFSSSYIKCLNCNSSFKVNSIFNYSFNAINQIFLFLLFIGFIFLFTLEGIYPYIFIPIYLTFVFSIYYFIAFKAPLTQIEEKKSTKTQLFISACICIAILFFTFNTLYDMKYNNKKEITNINQIEYKKPIY